MAKTAGDAQLGVTALNLIPAYGLWRRDRSHSGNKEDIENETSDAVFDGETDSRIGPESNMQQAAEDISKTAVDRAKWSKQKEDGTAGMSADAKLAYRKKIHQEFTSNVKAYGAKAAEEHGEMATAAQGGYMKSLALAMQNAIGAWGNLRAAKEMKKAASELEKSGDLVVPDFQAEEFPEETDAGRQDILPQPAPSAATAEADVLAENDVPNLGDGFRLDNPENVQPGPAPGAFKPDENRAPAGAAGGGGLSGSGTSAATAEDKANPR
jgi:hypothetical protein